MTKSTGCTSIRNCVERARDARAKPSPISCLAKGALGTQAHVQGAQITPHGGHERAGLFSPTYGTMSMLVIRSRLTPRERRSSGPSVGCPVRPLPGYPGREPGLLRVGQGRASLPISWSKAMTPTAGRSWPDCYGRGGPKRRRATICAIPWPSCAKASATGRPASPPWTSRARQSSMPRPRRLGRNARAFTALLQTTHTAGPQTIARRVEKPSTSTRVDFLQDFSLPDSPEFEEWGRCAQPSSSACR